MTEKLYLWRIKVRGSQLWCHAPSSGAAMEDFIKQTNEPLNEYCLEWHEPLNLDGTKITPAERDYLLGSF